MLKHLNDCIIYWTQTNFLFAILYDGNKERNKDGCKRWKRKKEEKKWGKKCIVGTSPIGVGYVECLNPKIGDPAKRRRNKEEALGLEARRNELCAVPSAKLGHWTTCHRPAPLRPLGPARPTRLTGPHLLPLRFGCRRVKLGQNCS